MKDNNEPTGFSRFLANLKALFSRKNKKSNNDVVAKDDTASEINVVEANPQAVVDAKEEAVVETEEAIEAELTEESSNAIGEETTQNLVEDYSQGEMQEIPTLAEDTQVVVEDSTICEDAQIPTEKAKIDEETQNPVVDTQIPVEEAETVANPQNDITQSSTADEESLELTPQQEYVQSRNINVTVPETTVRSFLAKLLLVSEETQQYYSELKNYVLSFVGTRCRTSWQYDSIYKTRILLARFVIRGKSLWQYVALTPEEVPEGTNCQVTDDKKYEGIEVGLKIQGQRTFKQAITLLRLACEKIGLAYEERESVNYIPAYMSEEEMLEKGYIKKVLTSTNPS